MAQDKITGSYVGDNPLVTSSGDYLWRYFLIPNRL